MWSDTVSIICSLWSFRKEPASKAFLTDLLNRGILKPKQLLSRDSGSLLLIENELDELILVSRFTDCVPIFSFTATSVRF